MITRTNRRWGTHVFLGLGLCAGICGASPLLAQNAGKPAEAGAAKGGEAVPATAGPVKLAKVLSDGVQLRCFASERSVRYEGKLAAGSTVEVLGQTGDFVMVRLPLGVVGYVSKGFASAPEEGLVKTTRPRVAFRYRPTPRGRAEAPVQTLPKDTALRFLADAGDWWKVRFHPDAVYMAAAELQVFEAGSDTLRKGYADLARRQEKEWQAAAADYAGHQAAVALRSKQATALAELGKRFQAELQKVELQREMAPLGKELDALIAAIPPDDTELLGGARQLRSQVLGQETLIQAQKALAAPPPAKEEVKVKIAKTPEDRMARFANIGWLSIDENHIGVGRYRLMKGGRILCYLNCKNMRYDLSLFEGVEVGVVGAKKLDAVLPYLEVSEVEVVGHAR